VNEPHTIPTNIKPGDFNPLADVYEASRPTYPEALLNDLITLTGVRPGSIVADIGAGTGKWTRLLLEAGLDALAVEPGAAMIEQGRRALAEFGDRVRWSQGTAEATGLPDRSVDWITFAQAFHWVDVPRGLPELHRILRPDGWVTALWNQRTDYETSIWGAVKSLTFDLAPDFDAEDKQHQNWTHIFTATGHFDRVAFREARHTVMMSRERFHTLWRSHNKLQVRLGPAQTRVFLDRLQSEVLPRFPDPIPIPYACRAWSAHRR